MASRAELVSMMKEIGRDSDGMSIEDMKEAVRDFADKNIANKKIKISADNLSVSLRKFLTMEADFIIRDKDKKELDYNLEEK